MAVLSTQNCEYNPSDIVIFVSEKFLKECKPRASPSLGSFAYAKLQYNPSDIVIFVFSKVFEGVQTDGKTVA